MAYVSLSLVKKHLNIESEYHGDDDYLEHLELVAEKTVQRAVCCVLSDMEDQQGKIPAPLVQAILIYVAVLYNSREAVAFGGSPVEVPLTFQYLIGLYRNYSDTTSDQFVADVVADLAAAALIVDTPEEQRFGDTGNLVINNEAGRKAVDRIAEGCAVDSDGNLVVNVERI